MIQEEEIIIVHPDAGPMSSGSPNGRALQWKKKALGVMGVCMLGGVVWFVLRSELEVPAVPVADHVVHLDDARAALDLDTLWRKNVEEHIDTNAQEVQQKIQTVQEELTGKTEHVESKIDADLRYLKEKMRFLEAEIEERTAQGSGATGSAGIGEGSGVPPKMMRYSVHLTNAKNGKDYLPIKTAENYIAAGAFAKGVLLSGVDASTASRSLSDPEPVLIRLLDPGTLPRKFQSDLMDCHMIGSAYGDLSSERAKMRIEKLTCTERATGEVVETEVAGFVTGEDGRSGVRGTVVSVDQKYLMNAQIFGTLGSFASGSAKDPTAYNPFTIGQGVVRPMSDTDRMRNNLYSGAGSSLDKLADYYIDRAESVQPVIQIGAGQNVDVVFTEGVYFGTSSVKKHLSKKRDVQIQATAENAETAETGGKPWMEQVR